MMHKEVSNPTVECPAPGLWHMHDDNSAEVEVLDFLHQLVRTLKPRFVVETGTHVGHSAWSMATAIMENNFGKLLTVESNIDSFKIAENKLRPVMDVVDMRMRSSLTLKLDQRIDLLFLDSDPSIRLQELELFWKNLTASSVILIHDVNTDCHKPLRERVLNYPGISVVMLPTPRGLAICQKR